MMPNERDSTDGYERIRIDRARFGPPIRRGKSNWTDRFSEIVKFCPKNRYGFAIDFDDPL